MRGFTLTTALAPNDEVMVGSKREQGIVAFAREIEKRGLPADGERVTLREHWVSDGRWGVAGQQMTRLVVWADQYGLFDLDGSGVPSALAVGNLRTAEWLNATLDQYAANLAASIAPRFERTTP